MKPAPFAYEAPTSLDVALRLLGEDARPLAGGQSLVPILNFRLATPALLVDLNPISELAFVRESDGHLHIGALTRQVAIERSRLVERDWPLLRQAVRMIGHAAIRSRGTVGAPPANADPSAELPAALTALDARFQLQSSRGSRSLVAHEFFLGPLSTAIEADELLTEIVIAPLRPGARTAFVEHARTHGDFATSGAAVVLAPAEHAAIALLGAGPTPVRAPAAELALLDGAGAREVAELAAASVGDEYRRALLAATVLRAIEMVL